MLHVTRFALLLILFVSLAAAAESPVRVGVFAVEASPPVGSPLAYDPTKEIETPLSCRGIVVIGSGHPIVLCAVDWIGIGNAAHVHFREQLAAAANTTPARVAVHTLHQHDAPWCDFEMDELLSANGLAGKQFDSAIARVVIDRAANAVKQALADAKPVTHVGVGRAIVERVASNRRILGADGKVKSVRFTATQDAMLQAAPEGVIDPELRLIAFFDCDKQIATLTFYATHPQSYYRTGRANPDFPGMARNNRQQSTNTPHIHFNGAGGNVGAGKYNDGSPSMRPVLAQRVEEAMAKAWRSVEKSPISSADVDWKSLAVQLPVAQHLDEAALRKTLQDSAISMPKRTLAAGAIVFLRRNRAGATTEIGCLRLGNARMLTMPGELLVEYQLAAKDMRPDLFVTLAAYGDYGPSYIGTAIAYEQGGYETLPTSSFVAPDVERVLLEAMHKLLEAKGPVPQGLGVAAAKDEAASARDNWPHWRGPNADGTAPYTNPPTIWDGPSGKNIRWKAPLVGRGSATPIVWREQVFVVSAERTERAAKPHELPKPKAGIERMTSPPEHFYRFIVSSYDRDTGQLKWRKVATEAVPHEGHHETHGYAAGSPTTDGERLYVSFGSFGIFCFDMNGTMLWERQLGRLATRRGWGEAVTPVVWRDRLLVNWDQEVEAALYCLDARTGQTIWKADRDEVTTWTTPFVTEFEGKTQVIMNGTTRVRGHDFDTGRVIWSCGGMTVNAIPSVLRFRDAAIVMSGYQGTRAVSIPLASQGDLGADGNVNWRYQVGTPYVPSPVLVGDHLYFTGGNGNKLTILDASTGMPILAGERIPGVRQFYASPIYAGGHVYFTDRDGVTVVLKPGPKLDVSATNKLGEPVDASPVAVDKQLFLRGEKFLYCIENRK